MFYRIASGDMNMIHVCPKVANEMKLREPIVHGLCTKGIAVAVAADLFQIDPEALKSTAARFTAPVYPGDTIQWDFYRKNQDET